MEAFGYVILVQARHAVAPIIGNPARDLPLLDLRMRLGEGSGAALGLQLVNTALLLLRDMSTFEDAGVSDAGA